MPKTAENRIVGLLVRGDSYIERIDTHFLFTFDVPIGFEIATTVATFEGWPSPSDFLYSPNRRSCDEPPAWSAIGTITEVDGQWQIVFELTSEQTEAITAGSHDWAVTLEDGDASITAVHQRRDAMVVCK